VVELLLALSVGVERLGDVTDGLLLNFCSNGEWIGIEVTGFHVDRIVTESKAAAIGEL
jgi:hypothetical protein